jgi:hypothetical protein
MSDRFTLPRIPAQLTAKLQRPALPLDPAVRAAGAIGLITVGIVHALEIQGQISGPHPSPVIRRQIGPLSR